MSLPRRSRPFGDLEATLMDLLWDAEHPLSVREAMEGLRPQRVLAYTTVMTVLDNLHRKHWLRRQRDGRAWRYAPALTRQAYTAQLMHEALTVSDDRAGVLARFVEEIDPADAAALAAALREVTEAQDVPSPGGRDASRDGGRDGGPEDGGGPDGGARRGGARRGRAGS
jgi:predicted transcriptional regulator